jgi:hypothetical protein
MTPLRLRMIEDMTLAGLAAGTQAVYIQAVRRLAAHYRRSPDQLSEGEWGAAAKSSAIIALGRTAWLSPSEAFSGRSDGPALS